MTSIHSTKETENVPEMPLEHYEFNHIRFPAGDNIPCLVHDVYIDRRGEQGVKLFVILKYGPFLKNEKVDDELLQHYIKPKYLTLEYSAGDSYELSALFQSYNLLAVRYPDFDPKTEDEEIEFLEYFEEVFDNFFIPRRLVVYVDTEVEKIWENTYKRTFIIPTSRLKY